MSSDVRPTPQLDSVLVQHLAGSPRTRTLRASRSGHRRQGVLLDDGSRIRRKGDRPSELSIHDLVKNHTSILEHVRVGTVEICDPHTEEFIPYVELVALIKASAARLGIKDFVFSDAGLEEGIIDGSDRVDNAAPFSYSTPAAPTIQVPVTEIPPAQPKPPEPAPAPEEALPPGPPPQAKKAPKYKEADLSELSKDKLVKIAEREFKLETSKLRSKQALIDAIVAAQVKE